MKTLLALLVLSVATYAQQPAPEPASPQQPTAEESEKPRPKPKGVIHMQEVKNVPSVATTEPCNNFSWAAALSAALASQNAQIDSDLWMAKYYGGSVCLEEMGSPDDLIRKAEGEHILDDGRHVQLALQYFAGLPSNASAFLVPILTDEVMIVFVDRHADLLIGATWDEYLSQRGEKMIDLKELHLLDPLHSGDDQKVALDMTGDEASKITGFMRVKVTEARP